MTAATVLDHPETLARARVTADGPGGDSCTRSAPSTGPRPSRPGRRRPYRELSHVGRWYARAHADRPRGDRFAAPRLGEITLPAGTRAVTDPAEARRLVDELPAVTDHLYANGRRTRTAVWAALAEHLDPETGLITAGHDQLGRRASTHADRPVPRSTVGRHVRALVDAGVLHVAQHGASRAALHADRDRAPTYVILTAHTGTAAQPVDEPLTDEQLAEVERLAAQLDAMTSAVDESEHLPEGSTPTRTQEITHPRKDPLFSSSAPMPPGTTGDTPASRVLGRPAEETPGTVRREHPERFNPRTRPEREIAVAWIAAVMGWTNTSRSAALRTENELRKITGACFAAGWSPAAVVKAFETQPDGTPWPGPLKTPDQVDSRDQPRVRNQFAVLTYRIAAWRDPSGGFVDPPIPTAKPPRGRPRKRPAAAAPPDVRPARSADVEAALAARRAQLAQLAADRAVERQARASRQQRHRDELAQLIVFPTPDEAPHVPHLDESEQRRRRAVFRARVERRPRRR